MITKNINKEELMDKFDRDIEGLYNYAFYRITKFVERSKDMWQKTIEVDGKTQHYLFDIGDNEEVISDQILKESRPYIVRCIHDLVVELLDYYNYCYELMDDNIILINGHKKTVYKLCWGMHNLGKDDLLDGYDSIRKVALVEYGEKRKIIDDIHNYQRNQLDKDIQYISLNEFFSVISDTEYDRFNVYLNKFNKTVRSIFGYKTVIFPSNDVIKNIKDTIKDEYIKKDYKNALRKDGIFKRNIDVIETNFFDRGLYKVMLGHSDSANSFISSEWYFQTHIVSSVLEQTAVIAGYLKSVEQLLYEIICLYSKTGKYIRKKYVKESMLFDKDSEDIDTSLGSLIFFIRDNEDIWEVEPFVQNYVTGILDDFRVKYRNDFFHKNNITTDNMIKEIRDKSYYVSYLLLGAIKISDKQIMRLGVEQELQKSDGINKEAFFLWLDRILDSRVKHRYCLNVFFYLMGPTIQFVTTKGYKDNLPIDMDSPFLDDEYVVITGDYTILNIEEQLIDVVQQYLCGGKSSSKLKKYKSVSAGRLGHQKKIYGND